MMYEEFLKLAKTDENAITMETYRLLIEPMYMATDVDKEVFVKTLNLSFIKKNFLSPNNVKKKIVAAVEEIRRVAGTKNTYDEENEFIWLARKFCELKGYEFGHVEYEEARNDEHVNTKFIAKIGNRYERYVVRDGKLVVSHVFFENRD